MGLTYKLKSRLDDIETTHEDDISILCKNEKSINKVICSMGLEALGVIVDETDRMVPFIASHVDPDEYREANHKWYTKEYILEYLNRTVEAIKLSSIPDRERIYSTANSLIDKIKNMNATEFMLMVCTNSSAAQEYLKCTVPVVFDDFKNAIANRIEGLDYHQNWYHLVAFILFVIRLRHSHIDSKTSELIEDGVTLYVEDASEPISYLNYFGADEFKRYIQNHEPEFMMKNVQGLMHNYILAWNENMGSNPPIAASICFAKYLATDDDTRHLTLVFDYLYDRFGKPGGFPLFQP